MLTGNYWDGLLVDPFAALGAAAARVAMLGTAAGTTPARTRATSRTREIDAVEIDGELLDIGRRYFDLRDRPAAAQDHRGRAAVPAPHRGSATT